MDEPIQALIVGDVAEPIPAIREALGPQAAKNHRTHVRSAPELSVALAERAWDVVLVCAGLPQLPAPMVLRMVRAQSATTPVVVLFTASNEGEAVAALRGGASDMVGADNGARLRAVLQRVLEPAAARASEPAATAADTDPIGRALRDAIEGISWIDLAGRYATVNAAYARIAGWPPEQLRGKPWWTTVHPQDHARAYAAYYRMLAEGKAEFEARGIRQDGSTFHQNTMLVRYVGPDGRPAGHYCFIRDVTQHHNAEEDARRRQVELAHVGRLITMGEMATGIAHELNQPLSAIASFVQGCVRRLNAGTCTAKELVPVMEQVSVQSLRAGEIIRRLRRFVLKDDSTPTTVYVNDLVREVAALLDGELRHQGVALELRLAPALVAVQADAIQIEQVILNLVRNGMEAMADIAPEKRLLSIETLENDDRSIRVVVRDHGRGIPPDAAERIFDPFYTTKSGGIGMGLPISRSIIEAHGGRLQFATDPRGGTVFEFSLPMGNGDEGGES